jgi:nitrite reductase (NO-forming)
MKPLLFIAILIFCSCNQNNSETSSKMVLGSPKAVITSTPNNERQKGPIGYGPEVPKLQDGDTVEVKFDVMHKQFQVKKDVTLAAWVFGDSIPGPIVHVRVGQTVKFSMTNRSNDSTLSNVTMAMNMEPMKPMQHSIDFHAAMVNPADKYQGVSPGETISFVWTANYPGVFMYHCATPPVILHLISGMVGMVIVDPKGGYPEKADREFAFVQNEYYLKQAGPVFLADTSSAMRREPTFVTFNGKVAQYTFHPIHVKAGEKVRVYFLNVGPNLPSSFHVIGTILDKVWLDGNPANQLTGMQSVLLGAAQGAVMDFVLPEKGTYTFLDHSFANATLGAAGEFVAD